MPDRSRVFLDISINDTAAGRLVFELFADKAPKTCENFRQICTGEHPPLTYKDSLFHRVIDEFMVQGGDITAADGTGGASIYGGDFADENIGWRQIDEAGLLCMANRGKDTNSSQFFITLAPCDHLNEKHTVFGRLVSGNDTLQRVARVSTDKSDRPLDPVSISRSGELERRSKKSSQLNKLNDTEPASSTSRGRHKHRRTGPGSPSRSPSPSRGHGRRSADRQKHRDADTSMHDRSPRRSTTASDADGNDSAGSRTPRRDRPTDHRRRSEISPDHNLRGRPLRRSRSPDRERREYRKRSTPPSRAGSRSGEREQERERDRDGDSHRRDGRRDNGGRDNEVPGFRRQRSFPNQYWERRDAGRRDWRGRGGQDEGRLGAEGGDGWGDGGAGDGGIVYKGRGAMKYRERNGRW